MKWYIRFCLILFVIGGCHTIIPFHYINVGGNYNSIREIGVWIDKEFSDVDKDSIRDSIVQWNYVLNGNIVLNIVSVNFDMEPEELNTIRRCDCIIIMKINSDNYMIPDSSVGGRVIPSTLAWVNAIGGKHMWIVRDRILGDSVRAIVLHELGHILGASHNNIYLMKAIYNWEDYRCIDKETIMQVAKYQRIGIDRLNYCEY